MIRPQRFTRKSFEVEAMLVTPGNLADVARWCNGTVLPDDGAILLRSVLPNYGGTGRAHIGEWVLRVNKGFKIYRDKQFRETFKPRRDNTAKFEEIQAIVREVMRRQDTATYLGNSRDTEGLANEATLRILKIAQ